MSDDAFLRLDNDLRSQLIERRRTQVDEFFQSSIFPHGAQAERDAFNVDYLEENTGQPEDFINAVKQVVPLHDLKRVMKMSHDDENLNFGAIQVKVEHIDVKKLYNQNKHLSLEIWYYGKLVYQRPLNREVVAWGTSRHRNSVIFVLDEDDERKRNGYSIINIVSLDGLLNEPNENQENDADQDIRQWTHAKIIDWSGQAASRAGSMSFGFDKNDTLYLSTIGKLSAVSLKGLKFSDQVDDSIEPIDVRGQPMADYNVSQHHGLRLRMLLDTPHSFEKVSDGSSVIAIFDGRGIARFNLITTQNFERGHGNLIKPSLQMRQLVQPSEFARKDLLSQDSERTTMLDCRHKVLKDGQQVTVVVRKNYQADIYWNCKLIDTTEIPELANSPNTEEYRLVNINFNGAIFECTRRGVGQEPTRSKYLLLSFQLRERTRFVNATVLPDFTEKEGDLPSQKMSFFQNLQFGNLVSPFQQIEQCDRYTIVSHERIISVYDKLIKDWVDHLMLDNPAAVRAGDQPNMIQNVNNMTRVDLIQATKLFHCQKDTPEYHEVDILLSNKEIWHISISKADGRINVQKMNTGLENLSILDKAHDRDHNRILYLITQEAQSQVQLKGYADQQLSVIMLQENELSDRSRIISYQAPGDSTEIVISDPQNKMLRVYKMQHETNKFDHQLISQYKIDCLSQDFMESLHNVISPEEGVLILFNDHDMCVCDLNPALERRKQQDEERQEEGDPSRVLKIKEDQIHYHKGVKVRNIQLIDDRHLYAMSEGVSNSIDLTTLSSLSKKRRAKVAMREGYNWMSYCDLNSLKADVSKKPFFVEIVPSLCGQNIQIEYDKESKRLIFQEGFNQAVILPLLHHNLVPLQGDRPKEEYLFRQKYKDQFIAIWNGKDEQDATDSKALQRFSMTDGSKICDDRPFSIREELRSSGFRESRARNSDFLLFKSKKEMRGTNKSLQDEGVLPYSLLYYREEDEDMDDAQFFGDRIKNTQMNEVSSLAAAAKAYHRFVVINLDDEANPQIKLSFTFPIMTKREQNLFLSDDYTKLIDIRREEASIYELKPLNQGSPHAVAEFYGDVMKLPFAAFDGDANQLFFMFSPDLSRHLDIDPIKKEWLIRESKSGDTVYRFNTNFLSYEPKSGNGIFEQARFIAWEDNKSIRLIDVNADPFVESLIQIPDRLYSEDQEVSRELASGTVPYIDIRPYQVSYENRPKHRLTGIYNYFKGNMKLGIEQISERLKRKQCALKRAWYLQKEEPNFSSQKEEGTQSWWQRRFGQNQQSQEELVASNNVEKLVKYRHQSRFTAIYDKLYSIDYLCPKYLSIEIPFTFVMWRQVEQLRLLTITKTVQANDVCMNIPLSQEIAQTWCLNIFPDIDSVLHGITGNYEFLVKFLSYAMPNGSGEEGDDQELFVLPFIQNIDGQTPLHLAMGVTPKGLELDDSDLAQDQHIEDDERVNMRSAELLISDILSKMPLDHHSRAIAELLPELVKRQEEIGCLDSYLESRWKTTKQVQKLYRQNDSVLKKHEGEDEGIYVSAVDLWSDLRLIRRKIFEHDPEGRGQQVLISVLDLAYLHQPEEDISKDFISALADVESKNKSIFKNKSIRAILNYRWEITRDHVIWQQMFPYICYFFTFLVYCWVIIPHDRKYRNRDEDEVADMPNKFNAPQWLLQLYLLIGAFYFCLIEIRQLRSTNPGNMLSYFCNPWNYIDMITILGIILIFGLELFSDRSKDTSRDFRLIVMLTVCFSMCIKMFYYLRVKRSTGYFVNMLVQVVKHSGVFFLLYILVVLQFGATFYVGQTEEPNIFFFLLNAYNIGLGTQGLDFENNPAPALMTLLYYISTLIISVIMLNLLVAVISEAYGDVMETQMEANDMERVAIINEVAGSISKDDTKELNHPNQYLIRALTQEKKDAEDAEE